MMRQTEVDLNWRLRTLELLQNLLPHFTKGEVRVGAEVAIQTIFVIDKVKLIPLDVIRVSVAVNDGAVIRGDVPELVCLEPEHISVQYGKWNGKLQEIVHFLYF